MGASQARLQRAEQRIVVQPMSLLRTKSLEVGQQLRAGRTVELAPSLVEQPMLESDYLVKINRGRWEVPA